MLNCIIHNKDCILQYSSLTQFVLLVIVCNELYHGPVALHLHSSVFLIADAPVLSTFNMLGLTVLMSNTLNLWQCFRSLFRGM